jgi:Protein of unknown function (DUF3631)
MKTNLDEAVKQAAIEYRAERDRAGEPTHGIDLEVERLSKLPLYDYDRGREEHAKELGIRVSTLDAMVAKQRKKLGLDREDIGQGRAVKIEDIKPWDEPVDGSVLVNALSAAVKKHVVLRDEQAIAIAYWTLHTWLVNEFHISPRLAVVSPTKGCGKTQVLRILSILARRPKRAGSVSPPALFRTIEAVQPTFLLDETEKYVEHGGDFHALLNEGHAKGSSVLRVLGEAMELREFSVFSAAAFARNGSIPDDLEQRSIVIELQRRKPDEPLDELREEKAEHLHCLARMCARWATDHAANMHDRDPDMGALINRGADNWRPLFTIADAIGGGCPASIRNVAAKLGPREASSYGVVLLGDIKTIFAAENADKLSSAEIVAMLHEMEGRPWSEWGRSNNKKPISKNQLAGLLKEFKIAPENIYVGTRACLQLRGLCARTDQNQTRNIVLLCSAAGTLGIHKSVAQ